jgi:hypothetical protein
MFGLSSRPETTASPFTIFKAFISVRSRQKALNNVLQQNIKEYEAALGKSDWNRTPASYLATSFNS